jgi:hypothetical protein
MQIELTRIAELEAEVAIQDDESFESTRNIDAAIVALFKAREIASGDKLTTTNEDGTPWEPLG